MKKILLIGLIALLSACAPFISKRARFSSFAVINEMYAYELKLTKLPAGSIPETALKIPITDTTRVSIEWIQRFETQPFDEQPDPTTYGTTSDTTIYVIMNNEVEYTEVDPQEYAALASERVIQLSEGEWQAQMRSSIWSSMENRALWSKYSNATPFFAYILGDPPVPGHTITIHLE